MSTLSPSLEIKPKARPIAYLTRTYRFSASHRLHSERYDEAQNREVFGKCNNPHGHGHNYSVELTLCGPVHPVTGMVLDLASLDEFAREHLIERFDGSNLNTLPCFRNEVSSTENLTVEIHRIFRHLAGPRLERVRIEETSNNSFDYTGPEPVGQPLALQEEPTPHDGNVVTGDDPSHSGTLK